jgi:hypothetical protein
MRSLNQISNMKYPISSLTKKNKSHSTVSPTWFSSYFNDEGITSTYKHFDVLGLKNFAKASNSDLIASPLSRLDSLHWKFEDGEVDFNALKEDERLSASAIAHVLNESSGNYSSSNKLLSRIVDQKGTVLFKLGDTVNKVASELYSWCKNFKSKDTIIISDELKKASHLKKRDGNYKIVFSSDPWDILTMSMRGIESCMRWDSSHAKCLVGSVLDPYAAVMYITDGKKTPYGPNMLYRSVVRLVKSDKRLRAVPNKDKFSLFVETAYSHDQDVETAYSHDQDEEDHSLEGITQLFEQTLRLHLKKNKKIAGVVSGNHSYDYYIPVTAATDSLGIVYQSYIDSDLHYFKDSK